MKCPYCGITFTFGSAEFDESPLYYDPKDETKALMLSFGECPDCQGFITVIEAGNVKEARMINPTPQVIYPKFVERRIEKEVPAIYAETFIEAANIFSLSPKASAALSRRLLQMVLRDHFNINRPSLAHEIDDFLKLKDVPSYLSGAIDAVRVIGNFAAHPLKESSTGMIVDVEPGEAEWLLDVLESLFDFAFVQPKRLATKQDALNEKLKSLGKPPMKKI